jgi:hypothetical protein
MKNKISFVVFFAFFAAPIAVHAFTGIILQGVISGISGAASSVSKDSVRSDESIKIEEPTRIQLRALQTRKFNKSSGDVVTAIIELYKDKNIQCYGSGPRATPTGVYSEPIEWQMIAGKQHPSKFGQFTKGYKVTPGELSCVNNHKFEISFTIPENTDGKPYVYNANYGDSFKETIVRVRIYQQDKKTYQLKQIYTEADYQKVFKEIADGLFIDAIQLTPAEMQ